MNIVAKINRLAWQAAVWIALLSCIGMVALTHDLLRSLRTELDVWGQYRSYGLVRTLGVELTQALEEQFSLAAEPNYQALLHQLWSSHPDVGDLAVLDASYNVLAMVGKHNPTLLQMLKNNWLPLNQAHDKVNDNNNVTIKSLTLSGINNQETEYRYGVIYLQWQGKPSVHLVVGFTPLLFPVPLYFIYAVPVVVSLLLGAMGWQLVRYWLQRHYLEPLTHLKRLGQQMASGNWPLQAVAPHSPDLPNNLLLQLASDNLRRSHAAGQFWQWQKEAASHVVPDALSNAEVPAGAPQQVSADPVYISFAAVQLGMFFFAIGSAWLLFLLSQLPIGVRIGGVSAGLLALLACAPRPSRTDLLIPMVAGLAVGAVAIAIGVLNPLNNATQLDSATTVLLTLVSILCWVGLCRAIWVRRKFF